MWIGRWYQRGYQWKQGCYNKDNINVVRMWYEGGMNTDFISMIVLVIEIWIELSACLSPLFVNCNWTIMIIQLSCVHLITVTYVLRDEAQIRMAVSEYVELKNIILISFPKLHGISMYYISCQTVKSISRRISNEFRTNRWFVSWSK